MEIEINQMFPTYLSTTLQHSPTKMTIHSQTGRKPYSLGTGTSSQGNNLLLLHTRNSTRPTNESKESKVPFGFPGGSVVRNPPANAGDASSIPGPGRSHMPWSNQAGAPQLSSRGATTTEPKRAGACALQQEKPCMRSLPTAIKEKSVRQ